MKQTSINAYNIIKENGLLSKLRFNVYDVLYNNGPMTQGELWSKFFADKQRHTIAPRFAELEKHQVIRIVGKKKCDYSGVECLVYGVTDTIPVPMVKKETKTQIITRLEKEIISLKNEIARLS